MTLSTFVEGRYVLVTAWQEISKSTVVELLDTIRNCTLNMALQIKDELGTSYADLRKIESKEKRAASRTSFFRTPGGTPTVAFGENVTATSQVQVVISQGDRNAFDEVLTKAGLDSAALQKLTEAIQEDGGKEASGPGFCSQIVPNCVG